MTRPGFLSMVAMTLAVIVVTLVVDKDVPVVPGPVAAPPTESPYTILSEDFGEWVVTGQGTLVAAVKPGEIVWTATGKGHATWALSLGDLAVNLGFQFPDGPVDAGVVVRIPGTDPSEGVEVELDANADGSARVGHIGAMASPLVYVEPRPREWHSLRVVVDGERVIVSVDGQHIADWLDLAPGEGRMAPEGNIAVRFSKGIRFRALELAEG